MYFVFEQLGDSNPIEKIFNTVHFDFDCNEISTFKKTSFNGLCAIPT
ncbi:MAG: hypothetical protein ACJA0H_001263 [Francisellaceae bacterium]|jgi:hypothetical protein